MSKHHRNFENEFTFRTSRSSGAGGQHVNTTETKVELLFDVTHSVLLSEEEKELLTKKWANRVNAEGEFKICSSQHRSQAANKEHVVKKFYVMLEKALHKAPKRIPTRIPEEIKEQIKKKNKQLSEKKAGRRNSTRDFL